MYKLREIEKKDIETINRWRNNPELIKTLGAPFRFINTDVDYKWFEQYMNNRTKEVRCAIVDECNDEILGMASLTSVDYLNQIAEFHIMIGDKSNQGKGIGTFAVNEMLKLAFQHMNLFRVELSVLETNVIAKKVYEKCGFVYEGRKRLARYKNGERIDLLLYSILKNEYLIN